jgi:hypothetical protein
MSSWPQAVRAGVDCHREADAAFHDLAVFREQSFALTRALLDAGVSRGAARAVGHAGWELLFDGALLDDDALVEAYLAAMRVEVHDTDWSAALERRASRGAPWFYGDAASVAELLWRVLGRRRLLAFDSEVLPTVTACLRDAQPAIASSVDEVFAALT